MDPQTKRQLMELQFIESSNNPNAVSSAGATGLMQVMPETAADPGWGVEPSDGTPEDTARVGRELFVKWRDEKYGGDPELAAIAYNWGPGNTDKWLAAGGDESQLPPETQQHISRFRERMAAEQDTDTVDSVAAQQDNSVVIGSAGEDPVQSLLNTYAPVQQEQQPMSTEDDPVQSLLNTYGPQEDQPSVVSRDSGVSYAPDFNKLDTLGKYAEHDDVLNSYRDWVGDPSLSDEDAATEYKAFMRAFNSNSVVLGESILRVIFGSDEDRQRMGKMLDFWEKSENFSDGVASITGYILPALTDPLNWASGWIGAQLGRKAAIEGVKKVLLSALISGAVDAPLNVGMEAGVQEVKMRTGLQEDGNWDKGNLALAAIIGAGVPITISTTVHGADKIVGWWTKSKTNDAAENALKMQGADEVDLFDNLITDIDALGDPSTQLPVIRENYKEQIKQGGKPKKSDPKKGRTVNSLYIAKHWSKPVKEVLEDIAVSLGPEEKRTIREIYQKTHGKSSGELIKADALEGLTYKSPEAVMRLQMEQNSLSLMAYRGMQELEDMRLRQKIAPDEQVYVRKKAQTMLLYARAQEAASVLKGIRSEWGVMGQVFQATKSLGRRASNVAMRAINDRYGANFDALMEDVMAGKVNINDVNAKGAVNLHKLLLDTGTEWFYNVGMLANVSTIAINSLGPIASILARNTERTIAGVVNAPLQAMGMAQGRTSLRDAMARWSATTSSFKDALHVGALYARENDPVMRLASNIEEQKRQLLAGNLPPDARKNLETSIKEQQRLIEMINQAGRSDIRDQGIRSGGAIGSGVPKFIKDSALGKKYLPNLTQGGFGYLVRTPTRLMGGTDIFYRTIAHAQSVRESASKAARAKGLQGQARKEFMDTYKPSEEELAVALREAEEAAFNQDNWAADVIRTATTKTARGENIGATLFNIALRTTIPFPSTPINLAMWTFDRAPVLGIFSSLRNAEAGEIVGRQIVGGTIFAIGALAYQQGKMTGYTSTWQEAQTVEAMGESPLSWLNDPGEAFNFSRIDPVAALMQMGSLAAALSDEYVNTPDAEKEEVASLIEFVMAASHIFARNFLVERTMLAGLSDLTKVASGEMGMYEFAKKRTAGTVGQMASPPFLRSVLQADDKAVRFLQGDDFADAVMDNIRKGWGFNTDETAPPRSVYGENVQWKGYPDLGGLGDILVIGRGRERPKSAHLLAMNNLYQVPYPPTPKKIYTNHEMTPHERSVYEKAMGNIMLPHMENAYRLHKEHMDYVHQNNLGDKPLPQFSAQMREYIRYIQSETRPLAEKAVMGWLKVNNQPKYNALVDVYNKNTQDRYEFFIRQNPNRGFSSPEKQKEVK